MAGGGFAQLIPYTYIFRHPPEAVVCLKGFLRQNAVAGNEATALMNPELPEYGVDIVKLRHNERVGALPDRDDGFVASVPGNDNTERNLAAYDKHVCDCRFDDGKRDKRIVLGGGELPEHTDAVHVAFPSVGFCQRFDVLFARAGVSSLFTRKAMKSPRVP